MSGEKSAKGVLAALAVARVFYALNWLNIGSVFPPMAAEFGKGVTDLGVITSSFYFGVGVFQLPGGAIAARWGAKKTVLAGISIYSACSLATGLAPDVLFVELLRFGVGVGMALIFAPMVVIVADAVRGENSGVGVGVLNSAFDAGGILGLTWGVVALYVGWRYSFFISGALGFLTLPFIYFIVPEFRSTGFRVTRRGLTRILRNKNLFLIGLGLLSLDCGNTILGGFMVYYLSQKYALGLAEAGGIASLIVIVPIFFAIIGGRAYDRLRRPKLLLLGADVAMGVSLFVCAVGGVGTAVVGTLLGGVATGIGFTVGFAAGREANPNEREYETLAVGWVNGLSLTGSVFPPLLFSFVTAGFGYTTGWLVGGTATLLIAVPLLLMTEFPRSTAA